MENRRALIFGATGGIGSAICRELSTQNFECFIIGRSKDKLGRLRKELQLPSRNLYCTPSITTAEDFGQTRQWLNHLGLQFSVAVHTAGFGLMKRAAEIEPEEWLSLIDINLNSAFAFFKLTWEFRAASQYELVFIGSASTEQAWPKNSLYGASKAGLEMFARSLHREIRPEGGRVWLYKPGSVRTGFFDRLPNHIPRKKMIDPATLAKLVVENLRIEPSIYLPEVIVHSE